ncbi:MAG: hypothetical protein NUW01_13790 [Gemmatimonadaceae bacterium]|nr:hypothetical protein [Gemmatimonadaceae bacterium]
MGTMLLQPDGSFLKDDGLSLACDDAYQRFVGELSAAWLVYGHNIRKFDLPLLNAGLMRRELPVLPRLLTCDTLRDYPKRKDMSASLENLAKNHGLPGGKKHMGTADWERANRLTADGMAETRKRVVSDVLLQERLRARAGERGYLSEPKVWEP